jgi:hypothetical protein
MCQSDITFFDLEFLKDVTTTLIGASIGTITAVLIYIGSYKKERKREEAKNDRESKNRLLYTSNLMGSFKIKLDNTIESLSTLLSQYENDPIRFHLPFIAINESSSLLNEILKSERTFISHNEFFGTEAIKHYNNLRNDVAFFEIQMDQLTDINIRAKDYDFQRKREFMELINHIMRDLINIYDAVQISKHDREEIFRFSVAFEQKLTDKTDVKFYHENYLIPLMNLLLKHSSDEVVFGIISQIKSSRILYQHIEANNKAHYTNLDNIHKEMNKLVDKFDTDSEQILNEKYT